MQLRTLCLLSAAVVIVGQTVPANAQVRMREMTQEGERAICVLQSVGKKRRLGNDLFRAEWAIAFTSRARSWGWLPESTVSMSTNSATSRMWPRANRPVDIGIHATCRTVLRTPDSGTSATWETSGEREKASRLSTNSIRCLRFPVPIRFSAAPSSFTRKPDTFVQPTGGAGGRVAFGMIGWAKPEDQVSLRPAETSA